MSIGRLWIVLVLVSLGYGQPSASTGDETVFEIPVVARDKSWRPVVGLTADDVVVTDKGKKLPISVAPASLAFNTSDTPQQDTQASISALVILPPLSLSSRYHAIEAIRRFASTSPLNDVQVAMVDASGEALPFTSNSSDLFDFLHRLDKKTISAGYESPQWVQNMQTLLHEQALRAGVKAAIVFADPDTFPVRLLFPFAEQQGVPLYVADARGVVTVTPFGEASSIPEETPPMEVRHQEIRQQLADLRTLAIQSGGQLWSDNNDLSQIFRLVTDDAKACYMITFRVEPSKDHKISVSSANPSVTLTVRGPFSQPSTPLAAKNKGENIDTSALRDLPVEIRPTVAFFPTYSNGLFMLAVHCTLTANNSFGHLEHAELLWELSSDLQGSFGVNQRSLALFKDRDRGLLATYDALAKIPAGGYTLTFLLKGSKQSREDTSSRILGYRRYRFLVHFQTAQPFYASSLLVGRLSSGESSSVDLIGVQSRARSVLLNHPLNMAGQHMELLTGNELGLGETFSAAIKIYADRKLLREIQKEWMKSAFLETLTGKIVAGPFAAADWSSVDNDGGLPIVFPISLNAGNSQLTEGAYQLRVEIRPSPKSKLVLTETAVLKLKSNTPK